MRTTRLILFEGIPGSGKSTTGQFVARQIDRAGQSVRWWYEEEADHPLYPFHDAETLRALVEDLTRGRYQQVVDVALERWERLAADVLASDQIVVLDSVLLGYLTWTLHPFDVPRDTILDYVARVAEIIRPCDPVVIYFASDVARTLRDICAARGQTWERGFIRSIEDSAYGKRKGLAGFDGLIAYWTDYGELADEVFAGLDLAKLLVRDAAEDWPGSRRAILRYLGLPPSEDAGAPDLARFAGVYTAPGDAVGQTWEVGLDDSGLFACDLPGAWPRVRLLPTESANQFAVESYPFTVTFDVDEGGEVRRVRVSGQALLGSAPEGTFERRRGQSQ